MCHVDDFKIGFILEKHSEKQSRAVESLKNMTLTPPISYKHENKTKTDMNYIPINIHTHV